MERQNIRHPDSETGEIDQEPLDFDSDDSEETVDEDDESDALDLD